MMLVLSEFACLRREADQLVAEGPDAPPVALDDALGALINAFVTARTLGEAAAAAGVSESEAEQLVEPLVAAGVVVDADRAAREHASPWRLPERLVHGRSRSWRPAGAADVPPPAIVASPWAPAVDLDRPDLDRLERDDPPFAWVQGARRSLREHSREPLPAAALGEFLYRVGRIEDIVEIVPGMTLAPRPYPGAGALYELELYPVVSACGEIAPGLYHYAADSHRLGLVTPASAATDELLRAAAAGMGVTTPPHVLLVIVGRLARLAWKYDALAYTLMLKDVGVLMQTMYLAATAMGLAGCAVGSGDADLFAAATRLDPDDQASVGEFCLGQPSSSATDSATTRSPS
jgi:SagB-type dehydrogenase family enzyme